MSTPLFATAGHPHQTVDQFGVRTSVHQGPEGKRHRAEIIRVATGEIIVEAMDRDESTAIAQAKTAARAKGISIP